MQRFCKRFRFSIYIENSRRKFRFGLRLSSSSAPQSSEEGPLDYLTKEERTLNDMLFSSVRCRFHSLISVQAMLSLLSRSLPSLGGSARQYPFLQSCYGATRVSKALVDASPERYCHPSATACKCNVFTTSCSGAQRAAAPWPVSMCDDHMKSGGVARGRPPAWALSRRDSMHVPTIEPSAWRI